MVFPALSKELIQLLEVDQNEWRDFARAEFEAKNAPGLKTDRSELRQKVHQRAERMLQILDEIGEPSLSNIDPDAAQAMSVLATHDSLAVLRVVLEAFTKCYERKRADTYIQAIPSMTDWSLILERKPQIFGTIWMIDDNHEPFLPTVQDFENVNERRKAYGIGLLRWPKSLAIPKSEQPWLNRPLSELVMREPTQEEYSELNEEYLADLKHCNSLEIYVYTALSRRF